MEIIKFKVAMDAEAKKNKEFKHVEISVDMESADLETVRKYAIAHYKVVLQGQIRPNWDTFITELEEDKLSRTLYFGEALYSKSPKVKKITTESAAAFLNHGSELEVLTKKIDLLEKMKINVPEEMWEELDRLSPVEE